MAAADDRWLMEVARSILEGERIDWEEVGRDESAQQERGVLDELRKIHNVAAAHRAQQIAAADPSVIGTRSLDEPRDGSAEELLNWGPLQLIERVGEGAFGEIYRARDPRLQREVALKMMREDISLRQDVSSAVLNEGRLLARVRHPNVATVHGVEEHGGRVGLWMEFIKGQTLEELSRRQGKLGAQEAGMIGLDLCRALAAVHQAGLIHRDVKPQNVIREEGGRIVLTDFGAGKDLLAKSADLDRSVSGTPLYMAPEVLAGGAATQQSDLYSLGVLLFHLLTGSYPVSAATVRELRERHAGKSPVPLGELRPDLPASFLRVIDRALAHEPADRFTGAAAMEQALAAALGIESSDTAARTPAGRSRAPGRLPFWVAAAVIVAGSALGWLALSNGREPPAAEARIPDQSTTSPEISGASPLQDVAVSQVPQGGQVPISAASSGVGYSVDATFYAGTTARQRLLQEKRIHVGDALSLDFKASRTLFVYVISQDDQGTAALLFPLPGGDLQNPLAPGVTHRLPGPFNGESNYWQVTSAGGREHFLILASPEQLTEFEKETIALIRPGHGDRIASVPVPERAQLHLRGITGLITAPGAGVTPATGLLFEKAAELTQRPESVAGVWLRRLDLDNPP